MSRNLTSVFAYLDDLRDSGKTNMWGSPAYIQKAFKVDKDEAHRLAGLWMKTFDLKKTLDQRVAEAEKQ